MELSGGFFLRRHLRGLNGTGEALEAMGPLLTALPGEAPDLISLFSLLERAFLLGHKWLFMQLVHELALAVAVLWGWH